MNMVLKHIEEGLKDTKNIKPVEGEMGKYCVQYFF